ncbi:MAG: hypothetical protein ACYCTE_08570 [Acidimicrobiales bacterium]
MIESDDLVSGRSNIQGSGELAELRDLVVDFRKVVASLEASESELTGHLAERDGRITELERLLAEARRSGKR